MQQITDLINSCFSYIFTFNGITSAVFGVAVTHFYHCRARKQSQKELEELKRSLYGYKKISLQEQFYMTYSLMQEIKKQKMTPDVILAILPGGGMIAEWLSRRFFGNKKIQIPIRTIWVEVKRDAGSHSESVSVPESQLTIFNDELFQCSNIKNILLVVDVIRSGKTIKTVTELLATHIKDKSIYVAVLIATPYCDKIIDHKIISVSRNDKDVCFEWKEDAMNPVR